MTAPTNILIVEDEPLIAMMLEDFLDVLGKTMAGTADNVADALKLVEAGGIDAAILDVNLRGGEKSWPIADALAAKGVLFVLATGGSAESVAEAYRGRPTLSKPFTMDAVSRALDSLG
ncbi:response regulator [Sphingomonas sp. QA11]|jgi:DNA-binding response OmpR family regulator|uniref:response regulator n=1 Tax=Sphingomonas sp. QA11 TaxID=2950605 RepID=UPI002349F991|nr:MULTISPECIES: response regulator [unclassified Sphingomonas]WCM29793.1 response regulator [Sphingomonas sp. QA11]WEK01324.1 MAG: response regulator [Sphingomonas sp.]